MHVRKDKMCRERACSHGRTAWKLAASFFEAKFTQGHRSKKKPHVEFPKQFPNQQNTFHVSRWSVSPAPHLQELISTYVYTYVYSIVTLCIRKPLKLREVTLVLKIGFVSRIFLHVHSKPSGCKINIWISQNSLALKLSVKEKTTTTWSRRD